MTITETAASAVEMPTATCILDMASGLGRPFSKSYTVSGSAAECLAAGQKWIEAFEIGADGPQDGAVRGIVTITITGATNSGAVTTVDVSGTVTATNGQSAVGAHRNKSGPVAHSDEDCAHASLGLPTNVGAEPGSVAALAEMGAANENGSSASWAHQRSDGESRSNFLPVLIIVFYTVATAGALYSAVGGSHDAIGYLASLFVFGSFGCRTMVPLRMLALASNVAFMTYAARNQLAPVLVLHALLLPTNIVRLWQIMAKRRLASYVPHLSRTST